MTKKQNNATTCNQPNGGGKVTPAHYEELEELQLESVAGGNRKSRRQLIRHVKQLRELWEQGKIETIDLSKIKIKVKL